MAIFPSCPCGAVDHTYKDCPGPGKVAYIQQSSFNFDFKESNNALIRALEKRVAKTEFTLAEAVRTVRRLEYQLELLDDRDNPGSDFGRANSWTE